MIENGFINLYTDEMPRALGFYVDTLGFRETFRVPQQDPAHVELVAGAVQIALTVSQAARDHQGIDPTPGAPTGCLVLWVHDLDAAFDTVTRVGALVVFKPRAAGNGNRNALVRDPDGNLVELVAKAHPNTDPNTDTGAGANHDGSVAS